MKPSDYKHIAAFGRTAGWSRYWRRKEQGWAAKDGAPVDVVYWAGEGWATMDTIGQRTRMAVETELNRGAKP